MSDVDHHRSPDRDRREIAEVVLRYCRGIDRLDMGLVRSAYHPGGIDHHTGFSGTVEDYIAWVSVGLARLEGTMHIIGNQFIELAGDRAVSETYGQAVHWGAPVDNERNNFTSGFRYVDDMRWVDGRWAIAERWAVREWTRSDAGRFIAKAAAGPSPRRDGSDPVQLLRADVFGPPTD